MINSDEKEERKNLLVLSAKDIQNLRGVSYGTAMNYLKGFNYFYINSKPYILASDFYGEEYSVESIDYLSKIEDDDSETKLVKVLPLMLTVSDIKQIFQCGSRQSYEIMDIIPGMFRINSKRYVREQDFKKWLDTLPNSNIRID